MTKNSKKPHLLKETLSDNDVLANVHLHLPPPLTIHCHSIKRQFWQRECKSMADGSHWSNQWLKMFIIFANEKWDTSLFRCASGAWMFCINLWWNEAGIIWTQDWFLRYNQKFLCPITPFSSLLQHLMVYKFPHFYLLEQASALCKSIISLSNLHSLMWWSLGTRRNFLSSAKRALLKNSYFWYQILWNQSDLHFDWQQTLTKQGRQKTII